MKETTNTNMAPRDEPVDLPMATERDETTTEGDDTTGKEQPSPSWIRMMGDDLQLKVRLQ